MTTAAPQIPLGGTCPPGTVVPAPLPSGALAVDRLSWNGEAFAPGTRTVAEEVPVALSYNRMSHAVMLASPTDLDDFAIGFTLAEGIAEHPGQITELTRVDLHDDFGRLRGIEMRMSLAAERLDLLDRRRRFIAGPGGCGLCGLDSLDATMRPVPAVPPGRPVTAAQVAAAVASLRDAQTLNRATRAVHAAGLWTPPHGLRAIREDVGRHNALDKLHGALARAGLVAEDGIVVLTSRISVELVQKAATMRAPILAAISAPTSLALATARDAGITLIAVARDDGFEICTHPARIAGAPIGGTPPNLRPDAA